MFTSQKKTSTRSLHQRALSRLSTRSLHQRALLQRSFTSRQSALSRFKHANKKKTA